jgi:hypothetical protein
MLDADMLKKKKKKSGAGALSAVMAALCCARSERAAPCAQRAAQRMLKDAPAACAAARQKIRKECACAARSARSEEDMRCLQARRAQPFIFALFYADAFQPMLFRHFLHHYATTPFSRRRFAAAR